MKSGLTIKCGYCGISTTRRKYCSPSCGWKDRRTEQRAEERNLNTAQLARLKQLNPIEFDWVQRIAPTLPMKDREPIIAFLSLLRQEGFEIIDPKLLTIKEIVSVVRTETDRTLKEVS